MFNPEEKLDFTFVGYKVKTVCKCYATKQKSASKIPTSYFPIPSGSIGEIRVCTTNQEYNIQSFLVKFTLEGQHYYGKLSEGMLEFID